MTKSQFYFGTPPKEKYSTFAMFVNNNSRKTRKKKKKISIKIVHNLNGINKLRFEWRSSINDQDNEINEAKKKEEEIKNKKYKIQETDRKAKERKQKKKVLICGKRHAQILIDCN